MLHKTFALSPWESFEILKDILLEYYSDDESILKELRNDNYPDFIVKKADHNQSPVIIKVMQEANGIKIKDKPGGRNYGTLLYTMSQNASKSCYSYLSYPQMELILKYLKRGDKIHEMVSRKDFEAEIQLRKKFIDTNWVLYTWDYSNNNVGGLRRSVISFLNQFRVSLYVYRNREKQKVEYNGIYKFIKEKYLKIQFMSSDNNQGIEDDLSFIFYIGSKQNNLNFALGQYRSIDCGAILSGTSIIQRDENKGLKDPDFEEYSKDTRDINRVIKEYFKEKKENFIKSPETITTFEAFMEFSSIINR